MEVFFAENRVAIKETVALGCDDVELTVAAFWPHFRMFRDEQFIAHLERVAAAEDDLPDAGSA